MLRKPVLEKENFEFKPVILILKITLCPTLSVVKELGIYNVWKTILKFSVSYEILIPQILSPFWFFHNFNRNVLIWFLSFILAIFFLCTKKPEKMLKIFCNWVTFSGPSPTILNILNIWKKWSSKRFFCSFKKKVKFWIWIIGDSFTVL